MMQTYEPKKSRRIAKAEHDPSAMTLKIYFKSGGVYEYPRITTEAFDALKSAPSVGKHFHAHIKTAKFTDGSLRHPAKKVA